jgi:DNA replication and repair protein RecF
MQITNLKLLSYRNHIDLRLNLNDSFISIVGPNGSGKTNLLESIYVISTGKSPRAKYDSDLINYNKSFATVNAITKNAHDGFNLEFQIIREGIDHRSSKKVKVNKVPKALSYFCGLFNSVFFMPEDIQLIKGPPSERRKYMDSLLTQVDAEYKKTLNTYTKAVRQRNKILEKINKERRGWDEIGYWTAQVLKSGNILQRRRAEMFEMIQPHFSLNSKKLNGNKILTEIVYKKNEFNEDKFQRYQEREIATKATLIGPHRDDFEILFDGHPIGEFGSRGQQRSVTLTLKLSEIEYIEKEKGERPILLLDDIFSELDEKHKKAVMDVVENQQTILTSTVKHSFTPKGTLIELKK